MNEREQKRSTDGTVPREPTEAMVEAGLVAWECAACTLDGLRAAWRAMYDAALAAQPQGKEASHAPVQPGNDAVTGAAHPHNADADGRLNVLRFALADAERELAAVQAERDAAVSALRVIGEELVPAGYAGGDRQMALANLRKLIQDRDALRQDAERYRLVRSNPNFVGYKRGPFHDFTSLKQGADLDADLDAAAAAPARTDGGETNSPVSAHHPQK